MFGSGIVFSGTVFWSQHSRGEEKKKKSKMTHTLYVTDVCSLACLSYYPQSKHFIVYLVATPVTGIQKNARMDVMKGTDGSFTVTKGCGTFSSDGRERCGSRESSGNWEGSLRWFRPDPDMQVVKLSDENEYGDEGLKRKFGYTENEIGC